MKRQEQTNPVAQQDAKEINDAQMKQRCKSNSHGLGFFCASDAQTQTQMNKEDPM